MVWGKPREIENLLEVQWFLRTGRISHAFTFAMQHRSHSGNSSENGYAVVLARRKPGTILSTRLPVSNLARPSPVERRSSIRAGPDNEEQKIKKIKPRRTGFFTRVCARLLIALIISQPIYVANGMEIADGDDALTSEVVAPAPAVTAEAEEPEAEETMTEENGTPDESVEDEEAPDTSDEEEVAGAATTTDEVSGGEVAEPDESAEGNASGSSSNGDDDDSDDGEEVATTTPENTATTSATATPSTNNEHADVGEVATSTIEAAEPENVNGSYVFNEGECTVVADEEFYCFKKGSEVTAPSGKITAIAAPDSDGDREIYLVTAGGTDRITNNAVDDFAPAYDPATGRIVWHSMINDRLQIMLYDRSLGIVQLTDGPNNSSNPHLYGDRVVWQEWIGDNWEIRRADNAGEADMEVETLTKNEVHDMFPQIYAEFITWQRQTSEGWEVIVYDERADTEASIEKDGDGKYENPRFMLLFDKRTKEGDIETVGYDLATGDKEDLKTTPRGKRDPVTPRDETGDAAQVAGVTKPSERRDSSDDDNPPEQ